MPAIDKFFKLAKEKDASDLHMPTGSPPILRIHGDMARVNYAALSDEEARKLFYEIMDAKHRKVFDETNDVDFIYDLPEVARFRCNIFVQQNGVSGVFRLIPSEIVPADKLNLPEAITNFATLKKGLVLVTGPTGSGKSTTLAALIDLVNQTRKDHIITVEDPIEFVHPSKNCLVSQRQIGDHTLSFAASLRAALREDPDVVLVGEMRDLETMELAIHAAETGHLVFATLHTTNAAKTVDRVIDAFPQAQQEQIRTILSEALSGVVSQVLLKRTDGKGRVAAFEILIGTGALANLIRDNKTFQIPSLMQTSKSLGMRMMDQTLLDLLKTKVIAPKDAYDHAHDKKYFEQYMGAGQAAGGAQPGRPPRPSAGGDPQNSAMH